MKFLRASTLLSSVAIFVAVGWFLHWTAGSPRLFGGQQHDYYNLLIDGFQDGSLAMKVTPDPWLGVDNTKVRHYLLDASFHQGRYFLYFGVTPALLIFWPWTALTGHDLPEAAAAVLLAMLAYGLSIGWLATLRRRFFPDQGGLTWLLTVAMAGVATGYPVVLRRPLFYEVAILSGVACSFAGLWCLTRALLNPARAVRWLGGASLCAGLAAGSRPTLIPGALLVVALAAVWVGWRERAALSSRRIMLLTLAAVLPAAACGAGLAWYNWARFGNPIEFGLLHQLGSNGQGFPFRFKHLVDNLTVYFLTPPDFSWFFPFFAPGAKPPGSYQEQVHGQFYFLVWSVAIALLLLVRGRLRSTALGLRPILALAALWACTALGFVALAWPHANRYMLDFQPVLLAVGVVGLWFLAGETGSWRWLTRMIAGGGVFLIGFNLCTSLHVHGFFKGAQPETYERLARTADRIAWPLHRLVGARLGGLELAVRFPAGEPGAIEPLLVAGGGTDLDALTVRHTTPGRARLVFTHLGYGEAESDEFDLQPGRVRWLKVQLGTLYPPPWHAWYDGQPTGMARAGHRVALELDGEIVLNRDVTCFLASANQMVLGRRAGFPIGAERFSGTVHRVRGLGGDREWLQELQKGTEAVRLTLLLPRDRFGAEEPLWLSGVRGNEDLLSVTYVREGVIRLNLLHAGWGEPRSSAEIPWDYDQPLELLLVVGRTAAGWRVEADGQVVLDEVFTPAVAAPEQNYLGCLPWPLRSCRPLFGGRILEQARLRAMPAPEVRARGNLLAGRPVHLEFQLPATGEIPNQPLLTTGIVGRGDGLFLESVSPGWFVVGLDHWGSQPLRSQPVALGSSERHHLKVTFGTKVNRQLTVRGRLRVELDGAVVLEADADFFPAEPAQVFFGANPIGMSTSQPTFAVGSFRVLDDRPAETAPTANP